MTISRWILGIVLTGILICLVDAFVGWRSVWESWRLVSVIVVQKFLLLFALSHAIRAWRIYLFKSQSLGLGYGLTIKLSLVHQSLNNLLPMRLGEASYPLLMRRYSSVTLMDATFDLLWLRVLDLNRGFYYFLTNKLHQAQPRHRLTCLHLDAHWAPCSALWISLYPYCINHLGFPIV